MSLWAYKCYDDGSDPNLWWAEYARQSKAYRGYHDAVFEFLEGQKTWQRPNCRSLVDYDGLIEVRFKANNIEQRIFGFYDIGYTFIVVGIGSHKQSNYDPKGILPKSRMRMLEIKKDNMKAKPCDRPT